MVVPLNRVSTAWPSWLWGTSTPPLFPSISVLVPRARPQQRGNRIHTGGNNVFRRLDSPATLPARNGRPCLKGKPREDSHAALERHPDRRHLAARVPRQRTGRGRSGGARTRPPEQLFQVPLGGEEEGRSGVA